MTDVPLTYEQMDIAMRKVGEQKKRIEQLEGVIRSAINRRDYAGNPEYVQEILEKVLRAADSN